MSCVVSVITPTAAIIAGDTRRCCRTGNEIVVISEDTRKVFSINDQVAIGFTGTYEFAMKLKEALDECSNPKLRYADEIAQFVRDVAVNADKKDPVQFVVAGLNSCGRLSGYTYRHNGDGNLQPLITSNENPVRYTILCDTDLSAELHECLIKTIRENGLGNTQSILNCVVRHIGLVASINSTVNSRADCIVINFA